MSLADLSATRPKPGVRQTFPIATMCRIFRFVTALLLWLPVVFVGIALCVPNPESRVMGVTGGGVALLYLGIWLWARPSRFEVSPAELVLVWPTRRWSIPRSDIGRVRRMERAELAAELGWAAHVGAGGLWGTFGWLCTSRMGRLDLYVTRSDVWVLVERISSRPLLITPENPEQFVAALS